MDSELIVDVSVPDVKSLELNGIKLSFSLFCLFCNIKLEVVCGLVRGAETTEQVVTSKKHPSCLLLRRISVLNGQNAKPAYLFKNKKKLLNNV